MDYTKEVFLKLLANCICEEEIISEIDFEKLDSEELIHLSRVNTVAAIVYSALKDFDEVPTDLLNELKNGFAKTVTKMSKYDTVQEKIVEQLNNSDFPYAFVKGKTIAKYYPNSSLREMSDLDVLVYPEDFGKAKKVFDSFCSEKPEQVDNEYEYSYMLNNVTIELQNNLAYEKNLSGKVDCEKYFGDLLNHRTMDGDVSVIEPSHSFIYTIYHMAQHFYYSGCGVRMIIDVAVFIKYFRDNFDWDQVLETLKNLELLEFATNVFSIIDEWFGLKVPSDIYQKREVSDECLQYILNAGVFGRETINSDVANVRRKESFFKWAFPSYSYMRQYSDWFENKPAFLLPVAYTVRIFKGLGKRGGIVKGISVTGQTKKDLESHKKIVGLMGLE